MDLVTALPFIMFAVLLVLLLAGYPVAFTLAGTALLFGVLGYWIPGVAFHPADFGFAPARIFGVVQNVTLLAVPLFIFMGMMLEKSDLARELLEAMETLFGRLRGGLAVSVVVVGALLAASTGIVGATVVTMGVLSLPTMLRRGYDRRLAVGTIAASGTLGQIIPPSIVLVLLGDIMNVDVGDLFTGALLPGLLLVLCYGVYVVAHVARYPASAPPAVFDRMPGPALARLLLRSLLPPALLVALVLGTILGGVASPTEAAACGAFGALVLTAARGRLTRDVLRRVTRDTAITSAMVFTILIGAQLFGIVFRGLHGDVYIEEYVQGLRVDPRWILVSIMLIMFALGFFLDFIEICFIVIPLVAPVLGGLDMGMEQESMLLWVAILLAINLQTSFLTPPFGFALFYLKGVAPKEVTTGDLYRGIVPFVLIQLGVLGIVYLFPALVLWLPALVFGR